MSKLHALILPTGCMHQWVMVWEYSYIMLLRRGRNITLWRIRSKTSVRSLETAERWYWPFYSTFNLIQGLTSRCKDKCVQKSPSLYWLITLSNNCETWYPPTLYDWLALFADTELCRLKRIFQSLGGSVGNLWRINILSM